MSQPASDSEKATHNGEGGAPKNVLNSVLFARLDRAEKLLKAATERGLPHNRQLQKLRRRLGDEEFSPFTPLYSDYLGRDPNDLVRPKTVEELCNALDQVETAIASADGVDKLLQAIGSFIEQAYQDLESAVRRGKAPDGSVLESDFLSLLENLIRSRKETEEIEAFVSRAVEQSLGNVKRYEQEAQSALDSAQRAARSTAIVAGIEADRELSGQFRTLAESEGKKANRWRLATVGVLLLLAVLAAMAVNLPTDLTVVQLVKRLSVGVSLLVLAGYLGKEAADHRSMARRSTWIALQLRTVGAFTEPLPHPVREELRTGLGRRLYGGDNPLHPASCPSDRNKGTEAASDQDLNGILDRVLEILRLGRNTGLS